MKIRYEIPNWGVCHVRNDWMNREGWMPFARGGGVAQAQPTQRDAEREVEKHVIQRIRAERAQIEERDIRLKELEDRIQTEGPGWLTKFCVGEE